MYRSFSSELMGFPDRSLRDDIPLALKYGYEGVNFDIKKEYSTISPSEFKELLAKNNLKNGGFGLPVEFRESVETYEADFKLLRSYCKFAKETESARCTTWIPPYSDSLDYTSNFKLHLERLSPVAKLLEEYDIRLGLEFMGPPSIRQGKKYQFIHDLDGLMELLDAIGTSNLGYLLDVWHWDLAGQVFEDFKKISGSEKIVSAHINDAPRGFTREEQENHQRELPGATGVLRIGEFMKALENFKYDGPVLVEPFSKSLMAMDFEDAVKATKTSMDKVWPNT